MGPHRVAGRFVLETAGFLLKHAAVHFIADGCDMARLFSPQKVAGSANFQVAHGDLETGPEH